MKFNRRPIRRPIVMMAKTTQRDADTSIGAICHPPYPGAPRSSPANQMPTLTVGGRRLLQKHAPGILEESA